MSLKTLLKKSQRDAANRRCRRSQDERLAEATARTLPATASDPDQVSPGSHLDDNGNESTMKDEDVGYRVVSLDPADDTEDHVGEEG